MSITTDTDIFSRLFMAGVAQMMVFLVLTLYSMNRLFWHFGGADTWT